jgi:hypothetical protein
MNDHEKLLLTNKAELENKISNLVERQLNNDDEAGKLLHEISASIKCELRVADNRDYANEYYLLSGEGKPFSGGKERKLFADIWESKNSEEFDFQWFESLIVTVKCLGLAEDASEEAKMLWSVKCNQNKEAKELNCKRQELESPNNKLLMLEVESANPEATAQS